MFVVCTARVARRRDHPVRTVARGWPGSWLARPLSDSRAVQKAGMARTATGRHRQGTQRLGGHGPCPRGIRPRRVPTPSHNPRTAVPARSDHAGCRFRRWGRRPSGPTRATNDRCQGGRPPGARRRYGTHRCCAQSLAWLRAGWPCRGRSLLRDPPGGLELRARPGIPVRGRLPGPPAAIQVAMSSMMSVSCMRAQPRPVARRRAAQRSRVARRSHWTVSQASQAVGDPDLRCTVEPGCVAGRVGPAWVDAGIALRPSRSSKPPAHREPRIPPRPRGGVAVPLAGCRSRGAAGVHWRGARRPCGAGAGR